MEDLECEETPDAGLDEEAEAALAALQASPLVHDVRPITGARCGWYATLWSLDRCGGETARTCASAGRREK